MIVLAIALGAAVGAPLRFVVERRLASDYPRGTLAVNVVGSAILGGLVGWMVHHSGTPSAATLLALVGTGFCGALTTFGGFAAQVLDLAVAPARPAGTGLAASPGPAVRRAAGYAVLSVVLCLGMAAAAEVAVRSLVG